MRPDEYRQLLKKNNVSQRMVAAHSGYSDTTVSNSLNGKRSEAFRKLVSICDEVWMAKHKRPTEGGLSEHDEEKVTQSRQLAEYWGKLTEKVPTDPANPYQTLVRQCHAYVFHHYFGLIDDVDLLADETSHVRYRIERFISIRQGMEQQIPYWVIACPYNLRVVPEAEAAVATDKIDKSAKGAKATRSKERLLKLWRGFIEKYPRYWIVLCQNLNKIGIPSPFSHEERRLSRNVYKSVKSGKRIPHKHRRSEGTGMMVTVKPSEQEAFDDALDQCVAEELASEVKQGRATKGSRPVLRDAPRR